MSDEIKQGHMAVAIFATKEPLYAEKDLVGVPLEGKAGKGKAWNKKDLTPEQRAERRQRFPNAGIGLLLGTLLPNGNQIACVDCDDDRLVSFATTAFGPVLSGKFGKKGISIFVQAAPDLKSTKLLHPATRNPVVEIMADSGMVAMPPSPHPAGGHYVWVGQPLLDVDLVDLPTITAQRIAVIRKIIANKHTWELIEAGPDVAAHNLMLSLSACGIAEIDDDDWLVPVLVALLPPGYSGNTASEIRGMLVSARKKGLGALETDHDYDPGTEGPIPLGYTRDGLYAFLDPVRHLLIGASASQLLAAQYLIGLAPYRFWVERYPSDKGLNALRAGEALISACRRKGPFNPAVVRGRGVWLEGDRIVTNFGGTVSSNRHLYLCFEPIELTAAPSFEAQRVLDLLRKFAWRHPQDAMLLFGWLAIAPICGVLNWRPHVFLYGPPRSGKTTIHSIATTLLTPLALSADGQSSEAGIRQRIGPDSLPVILDEFESDHHGAGIRQVLRLARSASSADTPVLRGTPEGRAMSFSLRTTFMFAAVNPRGLSQADQSRIMMLELVMHNNDTETARTIAREEAHIRKVGSSWCSYMVSRASLVGSAIDTVEEFITSSDRRHRQNISTLLAAGFVALKGRGPSADEAKLLADQYGETTTRHAEENERDDADECLSHLLTHVVDAYPLGHWLAVEQSDIERDHPAIIMAPKVLATYELVVHAFGNNQGLFIKNNSAAMEKVFRGTHWEGGAWRRALRKLPGSFIPRDPVQFKLGGKQRALGLPLSYVPTEPVFIPAEKEGVDRGDM